MDFRNIGTNQATLQRVRNAAENTRLDDQQQEAAILAVTAAARTEVAEATAAAKAAEMAAAAALAPSKAMAEAAESAVELARERALLDDSEPYLHRRMNALLWSAEGALKGDKRAELGGTVPALSLLLTEQEKNTAQLLLLPVQTVLQRWTAYQLTAAGAFSAAESLQRMGGIADESVLSALLASIDERRPDPEAWTGPPDPDRSLRVLRAAKLVLASGGGAPTAVTREDLLRQDCHAVAHLTAALFSVRPALSRLDTETKADSSAHRSLRIQLEHLTGEWTELKRGRGVPEQELTRVLRQASALMENCSNLGQRSDEDAGVWPVLRQRAEKYSNSMLRAVVTAHASAGGTGTSGQLLVIGEGRDEAAVNAPYLLELLPLTWRALDGPELCDVRRIFCIHEARLRKIFAYYACVQEGSGGRDMLVMSPQEFLLFVKDSRLPMDVVASPALVPMFERTNECDMGPDRLFVLGEFLEALCRLAAASYPGEVRAPARRVLILFEPLASCRALPPHCALCTAMREACGPF